MLNPNEKEKLQDCLASFESLRSNAKLGTSEYAEGYCDAMSFAIGTLKLTFSDLFQEFENETLTAQP